MYVRVPKIAVENLTPMDYLADDDTITNHAMEPGDEVNCLGFPFGAQSNPAGFPVLRSGKIASYPLLPTTDTGTFLLDFRVFPGNSGGPAYFSEWNRLTPWSRDPTGKRIELIMGLVSQEWVHTEVIKEAYGRREQVYPLGLAKIVHASLIRETIEMLPTPTETEAILT
jgi:hypothetical protein